CGKDGIKRGGVLCNIYYPRLKKPFEGDSRLILENAIKQLKEEIGENVDFFVGIELEFALLKEEGGKLEFYGKGRYFSPPPVDYGYEIREALRTALEKIGARISKNHHEVPPAKHEINIEYEQAIRMADLVIISKLLTKMLAAEKQLIATFMPKPFFGSYGVGMHTHMSIMNTETGENLFYDSSKRDLSDMALYFIGGILRHAKALAAITNPSVNSYKRLVPGWEAPVYLSWSLYNRSALIRIPSSPPQAIHLEYRPTDGSCNPYLALAAILRAGLDGISNKIHPPAPIDENIYELNPQERRKRGIDNLPSNLGEALEELEKDIVVKDAITPIYDKYIDIKWREWHEYNIMVHDWEREKYVDV
ncbi:MAG: glutamine synthetase, partial [Candidatus Bathyarchaeia archaeon]